MGKIKRNNVLQGLLHLPGRDAAARRRAALFAVVVGGMLVMRR